MRLFSGSSIALGVHRASVAAVFCRGFVAMGLMSVLLGLFGCDAKKISELEEGVALEADVRARFGEPEKVWNAADLASLPLPAATLAVLAEPGARTFEYNRQPAGNVNYMITIGADGKMSALRQVLNPQNFARVLPGMSMEQVRKLLGKPMKITPFALQQASHYDWRYLNPPSTARIFTVVFDRDLRVLSTGSVDEDSVSPAGGTR
jgi:SmpA / OmlA family